MAVVVGGGVMEPMTRDASAPCVTGYRVLLANPQIGTSAPPQRAIRPVKIFLLATGRRAVRTGHRAFVSSLIPAAPSSPVRRGDAAGVRTLWQGC